MPYIYYIIIVFLYTLSSYIGTLIGEFAVDNVNIKGMASSYTVHLVLWYMGLFSAIIIAYKKKYHWEQGQYAEINIKIVLTRICKVLFWFSIIQFVLRGYDIFMGVGRGELRTQLGPFGWFSTFIASYANPALLALSFFYFFFLNHSKTRKLKKLFSLSLLLSVFIALMQGSKGSLAALSYTAIIMCSVKIDLKKGLIIGIIGALSIIIIGTVDMNMDFTQSLVYNLYRASSLTAYGAGCVWDRFQDVNPDAYLVLLGTFGEHITSIITGAQQGSEEFLKYSFSRQITYYYYGNDIGGLEGTVNLTMPCYSETVFWLGHKYFFILSAIFSFLIFKMTIILFKSQSYMKIKKHTMLAIYFSTVFVNWMNSTSGSFITSLFGVYIIVYMALLHILLKYILRYSRIVKIE